MHYKCINGLYAKTAIRRFFIPEDLVEWIVPFKDYQPVFYQMPDLNSKPWADPDIGNPSFYPKWHTIDGKVNRQSYESSPYKFDDKGYPLNPCGRTGIVGRGILGRWGPNHAADPIVTRWRRNSLGEVMRHESSNLPILQFVSIERRDTKEIAIPGGMVDAGELVSTTLKREFLEEALNGLEMDEEERRKVEKELEEFFKCGETVYKGYVDDPRNTDNAWMETVAVNFHDESGESVGRLKLQAGDDASAVRWTDIRKELPLYASHSSFVEKVAKLLNAHW